MTATNNDGHIMGNYGHKYDGHKNNGYITNHVNDDHSNDGHSNMAITVSHNSVDVNV